MKLLVIANPAARRGKKAKVMQAFDTLDGPSNSVELYWTQCRGDGTVRARQCAVEKWDAVIAAGGDGTIREVAVGLIGTQVPMGIIPLGTANCLAKEAEIPLNPVEAAKMLLDCGRKRIHVGQVGDTNFLLMAGVGFDAEVVHSINLKTKKVLRELEYVLRGFLNVLKYNPQQLRITLDGREQIKGYSMIVGNTKFYGGRFMVTPNADPTENKLDICLFKGKRARDIFRYSWGVLRQRHLEYKDVIYRKASDIVVEADEPVHIQIDGDYYGQTPVHIRSVPDALTLMLPSSELVKG